MRQGPWRRLAIFAGITAAYYAVGRVGLSLAVVHASASAVWPPAGLALAALLHFGARAWPAVFTGAFLVNLTTAGSLPASVGIAAGNTAEAVIAAWLVGRFAGAPATLRTAPDVFRFAVIAAISTFVAATIGVASLSAAGLMPSGAHLPVWLTWWLGDFTGIVVFAPPLLVWTKDVDGAPRRLAETVAFLAAVAVVGAIVFIASPIARARVPIPFLTVSVLLWGAFRVGRRATALGCALLCALAVVGTLRGTGSFSNYPPNVALLLLQSFMGMAAIVMLAAAAEVDARRAREAEVRRLNDVLQRRVEIGSEELLRAHARLLEAQEVAHVGSWEWDVAGNVVWWSPELYRIYGASPDASVDYQAFLDRVHPDDRPLADQAVRRALEGRRPFTFEHRIVRPDGTVRLLHARGRVVCRPDGQPIRMLGTGQDITEIREAEEARHQLVLEQAARHEAEEASRSKDAFLASLSHELRTPVNAVLGWAHMLQRDQLAEPARRRAIDTISRNAAAVQRLVSDLLDVARIASGSFRLERSPLAIVPLAEAAVDAIRPAAVARGVTVSVHIDRTVQTILADEQRLQQVLTNLLENAVKFSAEHGDVTLRVGRRDASLLVTVEDDGPGIDAAFLPRLFQRFQQADVSTTREHGGLGLGLSIVRSIVELHGGSVTAENRPEGRGAIFSVMLPDSVRELV